MVITISHSLLKICKIRYPTLWILIIFSSLAYFPLGINLFIRKAFMVVGSNSLVESNIGFVIIYIYIYICVCVCVCY